MSMTRWLVVVALAGAAGCASREHLAEGYGRSYQAAFERQSIRNRDQSVPAVTGLDSQEATLISDKYRRSLAARGAESQDEGSVLYIAPQPTNSNRAMLPPPSVPKEQR